MNNYEKLRKMASGEPSFKGWSHWQRTGWHLSHDKLEDGGLKTFWLILKWSAIVLLGMSLLGGLL